MNSRYLYRSKRVDDGGWAEGLLTIMWGQLHIINPNDENTAYPIDTSTICQCTGLRDKKGYLIWENDICQYKETHNDICVIKYGKYDNNRESCHIGFYTEWETFDYMFRQDLGFWVSEREIEVIGNVFDNPELLKEM